MADGTHIEWTDATWNPITGCSVVSPGCTNCYAMKLAGTRLQHHPSRAGLTKPSKAGPVWTGEVRFNEQWLDEPLRWKRPRRIFVCAHADLFHESVPDEWIDKVFAVMALAPQHQFQLLTKRSKRMREYFNGPYPNGNGVASRIAEATLELAPTRFHLPSPPVIFEVPVGPTLSTGLPEFGFRRFMNPRSFPLPNVWLGVSVEDQARADDRIPDLLATPAAVRWISAEPLLGPVDLNASWHGNCALDSECWGDCAWCTGGHPPLWNCQRGRASERDMFRMRSGLDWVVVGGESGPDSRPMHPDWARSLRDQCAAAGVPFLFKQWGNWAPVKIDDEDENRRLGPAYPIEGCSDPSKHQSSQDCLFWQGDKLVHWPHVKILPAIGARRIGKKGAGRLLDGVEHNGYPEVLT